MEETKSFYIDNAYENGNIPCVLTPRDDFDNPLTEHPSPTYKFNKQ